MFLTNIFMFDPLWYLVFRLRFSSLLWSLSHEIIYLNIRLSNRQNIFSLFNRLPRSSLRGLKSIKINLLKRLQHKLLLNKLRFLNRSNRSINNIIIQLPRNTLTRLRLLRFHIRILILRQAHKHFRRLPHKIPGLINFS